MATDAIETAIMELETIAANASSLENDCEAAIHAIKIARDGEQKAPPSAIYSPLEELDALLGFQINGPQMWHDRLERVRELVKLENR